MEKNMKKVRPPKRFLKNLNPDFLKQQTDEIQVLTKGIPSKNINSMSVDELFIHYFLNFSKSNDKSKTFDPSLISPNDYLIISTPEKEFKIPNEVISKTPWFKTLFSSDIEFKEKKTRTVKFQEFDSTHIELVLRWLWLDSIFNTESKIRVPFQYSINPEDMLQVLEVAEYLDIEPLVDSLLNMVIDYITDIPDLFKYASSNCLEKIFKKVKNPIKLLEIESREDFEFCQKDTTYLWKSFSPNWNPSILSHCCSWEPITVLFQNGILDPFDKSFSPKDNKNRVWSQLFCEQEFYELARTMSGLVIEKFKSYLEYGNFIKKFSFSGETLPFISFTEIIEYLPNLTYLEIIDTSFTEDFKNQFFNALEKKLDHLECLKISKCKGEIPIFLGEFLRNFPKKVLKVEFSNLGLTKEDISIFGSFLKSSSITHLSFANNQFELLGFISILNHLPECLKVFDFSSNNIKFFRGLKFDAKDYKTSVILKEIETLILSGNLLDIKLFDSSNFPNLSCLDMSECSLGDEMCTWICRDSGFHLKALDLSHNYYTLNLSSICKMTSLIHLQVNSTIFHGFLPEDVNFPNLKTLRMSGCEMPFSEILSQLLKSNTLEWINLSSIRATSSNDLIWIENLCEKDARIKNFVNPYSRKKQNGKKDDENSGKEEKEDPNRN